jgi:hypothetical protein
MRSKNLLCSDGLLASILIPNQFIIFLSYINLTFSEDKTGCSNHQKWNDFGEERDKNTPSMLPDKSPSNTCTIHVHACMYSCTHTHVHTRVYSDTPTNL